MLGRAATDGLLDRFHRLGNPRFGGGFLCDILVYTLAHGDSKPTGVNMATRVEHDSLGNKEIPQEAYYGIQTQRAVENFQITGNKISSFPHLIRALAIVKKASAHANMDLGVLPRPIGEAISRACDELINGKHHSEFVVDLIQGGAGTSTNMNANEVIANVALELLGKKRGQYEFCHPNDHVNLSQSTNDAYPTAVRLAVYEQLGELIDAMQELTDSFRAKSKEFSHILKMGRTQLQDAVPMTLGQEFGSYALSLAKDLTSVCEAREPLREMNMGGTAIGTGLNAPAGYADLSRKYLTQFSGISLTTAEDLVQATQDTGAFVQVSGVLKQMAVKLSKTCNDLRLLSSGPRAGLREINLPPMQPGSSIMPGKVNPVIPEVVNQICFLVIGSDVSVSFAAEAGQLELNVMEPAIVYVLYTNINMLTRACRTLAERCINGITANEEACRRFVETSIGLVTALAPKLGYEKASLVAGKALHSNKTVADVVLEEGYLTRQELDELLKPETMIRQ